MITLGHWGPVKYLVLVLLDTLIERGTYAPAQTEVLQTHTHIQKRPSTAGQLRHSMHPCHGANCPALWALWFWIASQMDKSEAGKAKPAFANAYMHVSDEATMRGCRIRRIHKDENENKTKINHKSIIKREAQLDPLLLSLVQSVSPSLSLSLPGSPGSLRNPRCRRGSAFRTSPKGQKPQ